MARRRYRSDALSGAGQQERPRDPEGDTSLAQPIEPRQEYGKPDATAQPQATPEPSPHFQTSLGEQMRAQRAYAEQQQLAQLHSHIDQVPNLSGAQRAWLHSHPAAFFRFDLLHAAHQMAQTHGIAPDSEDYFRVLESALHHYGHLPPQQMAQTAPLPAPAPSVPPMPPPMPAPTHVDVEKVESPEHEQEEHMAAHVGVSAPVSRASEAYSADYEPNEGSRVVLSKSEREHAAAAGVSDEVYAREKMRMMKMKKARVIKDE